MCIINTHVFTDHVYAINLHDPNEDILDVLLNIQQNNTLKNQHTCQHVFSVCSRDHTMFAGMRKKFCTSGEESVKPESRKTENAWLLWSIWGILH